MRLVSASARGGSRPPRYVWMTPSLRRTPVPGVWGTEAMGRTLRTLRWSSSMRRARQVATDRRHTFGAAAIGRAMLSNQNNSVSVCNRVTMPLTSPGVESATRAITKRKRRLDSSMAMLKVDSWPPLGEQGTKHSPHSGSATPDSASTGLPTQLPQRGPRIDNQGLQLRVGVLPEVHEAAVVLTGLGVVAARRVQLAEPPQRRRDRVRVHGIKQHERSPDSRRGYRPLVHGQRRVRLAGTLISGCELEQAIGRVFGLLRPRTIPDDRLLHAPLGKSRDSRARIRRPRPILHGHLPTAASARRRPISRRRAERCSTCSRQYAVRGGSRNEPW